MVLITFKSQTLYSGTAVFRGMLNFELRCCICPFSQNFYIFGTDRGYRDKYGTFLSGSDGHKKLINICGIFAAEYLQQ